MSAARGRREASDKWIDGFEFLVLESSRGRWVTHAEIAQGANIGGRTGKTARDLTLYLCNDGSLDKEESYPHRYQFFPHAEKCKGYQRLQRSALRRKQGRGAPS